MSKRGYESLEKTDAIRRIEEVEDELAKVARESLDARGDKINELREKLTDARADLVEAEIDELIEENNTQPGDVVDIDGETYIATVDDFNGDVYLIHEDVKEAGEDDDR